MIKGKKLEVNCFELIHCLIWISVADTFAKFICTRGLFKEESISAALLFSSKPFILLLQCH